MNNMTSVAMGGACLTAVVGFLLFLLLLLRHLFLLLLLRLLLFRLRYGRTTPPLEGLTLLGGGLFLPTL